jgi:hypothetical protein
MTDLLLDMNLTLDLSNKREAAISKVEVNATTNHIVFNPPLLLF